jgi:hypothetical protein
MENIGDTEFSWTKALPFILFTGKFVRNKIKPLLIIRIIHYVTNNGIHRPMLCILVDKGKKIFNSDNFFVNTLSQQIRLLVSIS